MVWFFEGISKDVQPPLTIHLHDGEQFERYINSGTTSLFDYVRDYISRHGEGGGNRDSGFLPLSPNMMKHPYEAGDILIWRGVYLVVINKYEYCCELDSYNKSVGCWPVLRDKAWDAEAVKTRREKTGRYERCPRAIELLS